MPLYSLVEVVDKREVDRSSSVVDQLQRWLSDQGASPSGTVRSPEKVEITAQLQGRPLRAVLRGVTPIGLFVDAVFVPLTLTVEIGHAVESPTVFAARQAGPTLWQIASGPGWSAATLSGLDPLAPLNRLSRHVVSAFLRWSEPLLSSDPLEAARLADRASVEALQTATIWSRFNLSLGVAWKLPTVAERRLHRQLLDDLRRSELFSSVTQTRRGRRGAVSFGPQIHGEVAASPAAVEIVHFHLQPRTAPITIDHTSFDVIELERSATLVPGDWVHLCLIARGDLDLRAIEQLVPLEPQRRYCCWLTPEQVRGGKLIWLLDDLGQHLGARTLGPYR